MLKKLGFSLSLIFTLTACGGGSDDGNSSTNGSNTGNNKIQCNKGIPSGMATLGQGPLDEILYSFDQQTDLDEITHRPTAQLVEEKTQLIKNTQYTETTAVSHPNNDVDATSHTFDYLLNKNGLFTTENYKAAIAGWPKNYVSKMENNKITLNAFNDQCDLTVDSGDYNVEKVDLSGKTLATLFTLNTNTSDISYQYIERALGYFLNPSHPITETEKHYQQNFNNMLKSDVTFPAGSYIYIMTQTKQHDTVYLFDQEPTTYLTPEDWAHRIYPLKTKWKMLNISGYSVYQAVEEDGSLDCMTDPAIIKNGKIYDGECRVADQNVTNFKDDKQFYMNQTARDVIRTQLKTYYKFN